MKEKVQCFIKNCAHETNNIHTWTSHFSREHDVSLVQLTDLKPDFFVPLPQTSIDVQISDVAECDIDEELDNSAVESSSIDPDEHIFAENFEKSLGTFFLKMQVVWHIPEYAVQDMSETFFTLYNCALKQALGKMGAHFDVNIAKEVLGEIVNRYGKFSSNYRRKSYFMSEMPYVAPSIFINVNFQQNLIGRCFFRTSLH